MPIRAIITDMGGVLLRTQDQSGRRKWENRLHLSEGGLAELVFGSKIAAQASIGRLSEKDVWDHVARTLRLDRNQRREIERDFWSGDRVNTQFVQYLRGLRHEYKTAILSNAWPRARHMITSVLRFDDAFHTLVISAEEGVAKPDAQIYQIALQRLGTLPAETIFVDDVLANIEAAHVLGIHAVQFIETQQAISEIDRLLEA